MDGRPRKRTSTHGYEDLTYEHFDVAHLGLL
jgi:hypothetical protein